jgi:hypothetical protein
LERTEITVINIVSCRLNNIISQLNYVHFKITIAGDSRNTTNDTAALSKQIFLYLDDDPNIKEMAEIETIFSSRGYTVSFRTTDYKMMHLHGWNRNPQGAEKGTKAVLPRPVAGMAVYALNRYSPSRDWFKGPPVECPLQPDRPTEK